MTPEERELLSIIDPEESRCMECNWDGFNRTGLKPVWLSAATTYAIAIRCPNDCDKGLK